MGAQDNDATAAPAAAFIARWQGKTASELATAQSFFLELCALLAVPVPSHESDYQFERPITFTHGDGSASAGRIDCYRRGHFVWESKKIRDGERLAAAGARRFDEAMLRARQQAEDYARALPAAEGRPPFLVVVDVGHVIELYAEFTRSGATYTPFPDPRSHRIRLADLADAAVRERLRALWLDPLALDPARASAKVTRAVAAELAELARSLEAAGHAPQAVAGFLTRCLFSMFAEDVGLLPAAADGRGSFVHLLTTHRDKPDTLAKMLASFWEGMDRGGFNAAIAQDVLRFNGKLFKGAGASGYVLPLAPAQIDGLLRAARANWQEVEPAIFGTLLERALAPEERHALGAHYTPRAYVERLVLPTVIEPLRADWANAQAAALVLAREADALEGKKRDAKMEEARAELRRFHHQLCTTRVLDPACGSGNFLYVTLEHLKRLEGEVLDQLDALGETQDKLGLEGETVTLQQLRGIELNERAAALAELVLWIGWLQWHVRTRGLGSVAEPVVHDYGNIECRDAVLAWDRIEPAADAAGRPLTRWDGRTMKTHPVTGEAVPDEAAQVQVWRYVNPRPAVWPEVEFIVGNPPFIGKLRLREALGDGYVEALRLAWQDVPDSADFVMYWWNIGARSVRSGKASRFGFITTNSLSQTFNRRVIEAHLEASSKPLNLAFVVPDHPWVDGTGNADVRIAMTVGQLTPEPGTLISISSEQPASNGEVTVTMEARQGRIHSDLRLGANVAMVRTLLSNSAICNVGVIPHGDGFVLLASRSPLTLLAQSSPSLIKPFSNGKDISAHSRGASVIDTYGLTEQQLRSDHPAIYQWLVERVKPERDQNPRASRRLKWWLFGENHPRMRASIEQLSRYIATVFTSKHRVFFWVDGKVLPDQTLVVVGHGDASVLGVLSSQVHVAWALAAGGRLGVGNDPRYNKTRCFETFPFPADDTGLTPELSDRIRTLAEQLDAHRKARQAAHASVTLTGMYNVLEKLRRGEPLNAKEKLLHEQALVRVLQSLHDELDAAVLAAYGWSDLGHVPWADEAARAAWTETLLERLVALNAKRAAEEAAGTVRWLRPEFQDPARRAGAAATQTEIEGLPAAEVPAEADDEAATPATSTPATARLPWPAELPAQVKAVAEVLAASPGALTEAALAERFSGRGPWKKRLPQILGTLEAVGRARATALGWRA